MQKNKFIKFLTNTYTIALIIIILTASILFTYFVLEEYSHSRKKIQTVLVNETDRIEKTFSDIIDHTAFIMKVIVTQIKPNYEDKDYIFNVINKYAVDPKLNNVLSWTVFSWINSKNVKLVDSFSGKKTEIKNISKKYYLHKSKIFPNRIHLGKPTFGFTSQRYVIPAALGVYNADKYIGALTIGFDLVQLSSVLTKSVIDQSVSFALLDSNFDIITQSPANIYNAKKHTHTAEIKKFIKTQNVSFNKLKEVSQITLSGHGQSYSLHRLRDYPYALFLSYDSKSIKNMLWKDITFRIVEIIVLSLVAFVIVVFIRNREKALREKAEDAQKLAEDASQAKTNFLAYTAHELRSPLSYIISSSEMMLKNVFGKIPKKYANYIKNINLSSRELLDFIDELLNEMKAKKGKFNVSFKQVNLKDILLRSIKINSINYDNKVSYNLSSLNNLPIVKTDPKRIAQVFNNIISNATKYSPEDSEIKIYSRSKIVGLEIYFEDEGMGMSEEELNLSKTKFGVVEANTNNKSIGLGLPLIIELTETLGAKLSITSSLGKGTKVVILFPKKLILEDV